MGTGVFDTANFWSELSSEMSRFDEMMQTFMQHFPSSVSSSGVQDNQYKINIALTGFEEKNIVVKARDGLVMVQATQTSAEGNGRSYMDVRSLPSFVNVAGSWTYEQGLLKIVFPLKEGSSTIAPTEASTEFVTQAPKDREEVESQENQNANQDADVGIDVRINEDMSNEIDSQDPVDRVEATTYAVDIKDEVEFVPVKY